MDDRERSAGYHPSRHLLACLVIAVAAILAYLPSFSVPFHYDDLWEILNNRALQNLADWRTIFAYNPARALLMFTFALDLRLWGENTFPYHVENLAIHVANAFLIYFLAERLLGRLFGAPSVRSRGLEVPAGWSPAFAVALVFAVHPLFVEAVTYIASRSSSLATLFYLLAFAAFVAYRDAQARTTGPRPPAWPWLLMSINAYLLAIFTKEEGVSLPAIILAYDLLLAPRKQLDGAPAAARRRWWAGSVPFWLVLGALVLARVQLFGGASPDIEAAGSAAGGGAAGVAGAMRRAMMPPVEVRGVVQNLLTEAEATIKYLRLFVAPYGLSIYHDYPVVTTWTNVRTVLALAFHALLLGLAAWCWKRRPMVSFGIVWFYITLSPTSSFIPLKEVMAEHRMYLAGFGPLLAIGDLLGWLRDRWRVPCLAVAILASLPLAVVTFQYNLVWQDDIALWERATRLAPHSGDAYYALGDACFRVGRLDDAADAYRKAIRAYEDLGVHLPGVKYTYSYVDALNNLGLVYARKGKLDLAISHFRRALHADVNYTQAWNNLGYAQVQKGLYFEASLAFEEAIETDPDSWLGHYHLAEIYYDKLVDREKAAYHYRRALEINPDMPNAAEVRLRLAELDL